MWANLVGLRAPEWLLSELFGHLKRSTYELCCSVVIMVRGGAEKESKKAAKEKNASEPLSSEPLAGFKIFLDPIVASGPL